MHRHASNISKIFMQLMNDFKIAHLLFVCLQVIQSPYLSNDTLYIIGFIKILIFP